MNKGKFENKPKNPERFKGQAFRNVCNKGVVIGITVAVGFFVLGTLSAWKADFQYRKQIKNKVNNG